MKRSILLKKLRLKPRRQTCKIDNSSTHLPISWQDAVARTRTRVLMTPRARRRRQLSTSVSLSSVLPSHATDRHTLIRMASRPSVRHVRSLHYVAPPILTMHRQKYRIRTSASAAAARSLWGWVCCCCCCCWRRCCIARWLLAPPVRMQRQRQQLQWVSEWAAVVGLVYHPSVSKLTPAVCAALSAMRAVCIPTYVRRAAGCLVLAFPPTERPVRICSRTPTLTCFHVHSLR